MCSVLAAGHGGVCQVHRHAGGSQIDHAAVCLCRHFGMTVLQDQPVECEGHIRRGKVKEPVLPAAVDGDVRFTVTVNIPVDGHSGGYRPQF